MCVLISREMALMPCDLFGISFLLKENVDFSNGNIMSSFRISVIIHCSNYAEISRKWSAPVIFWSLVFLSATFGESTLLLTAFAQERKRKF